MGSEIGAISADFLKPQGNVWNLKRPILGAPKTPFCNPDEKKCLLTILTKRNAFFQYQEKHPREKREKRETLEREERDNRERIERDIERE